MKRCLTLGCSGRGRLRVGQGVVRWSQARCPVKRFAGHALKPITLDGPLEWRSVPQEDAMGHFEFMFPEQAQAEHLKELARLQQVQLNRSIRTRGDSQSRLVDLEADLGYITLILGSILERLDKKGIVTRDEVKSEMSALDEIDGVKNGRLDINFLRGRHE